MPSKRSNHIDNRNDDDDWVAVNAMQKDNVAKQKDVLAQEKDLLAKGDKLTPFDEGEYQGYVDIGEEQYCNEEEYDEESFDGLIEEFPPPPQAANNNALAQVPSSSPPSPQSQPNPQQKRIIIQTVHTEDDDTDYDDDEKEENGFASITDALVASTETLNVDIAGAATNAAQARRLTKQKDLLAKGDKLTPFDEGEYQEDVDIGEEQYCNEEEYDEESFDGSIEGVPPPPQAASNNALATQVRDQSVLAGIREITNDIIAAGDRERAAARASNELMVTQAQQTLEKVAAQAFQAFTQMQVLDIAIGTATNAAQARRLTNGAALAAAPGRGSRGSTRLRSAAAARPGRGNRPATATTRTRRIAAAARPGRGDNPPPMADVSGNTANGAALAAAPGRGSRRSRDSRGSRRSTRRRIAAAATPDRGDNPPPHCCASPW